MWLMHLIYISNHLIPKILAIDAFQGTKLQK